MCVFSILRIQGLRCFERISIDIVTCQAHPALVKPRGHNIMTLGKTGPVAGIFQFLVIYNYLEKLKKKETDRTFDPFFTKTG